MLIFKDQNSQNDNILKQTQKKEEQLSSSRLPGNVLDSPYGYFCRCSAWLLCSGWEQVWPLRCNHRIFQGNIPWKLNNTLRHFFVFLTSLAFFSWINLRPISISQLNTSLCFHPWPIYLVVFKGSYSFKEGNLILESVSHLDAFSAYPVRSQLSSCATGVTTGAP